ncbi:CHC2 zinc finger domain-containing protein [Marinibactrum halimedae]|uniref:Toprim domain-containing protein n=1 Tax=Marinibactrum halimedae TaxID=1444977 RepID=A0AA37WKU3_9GAMM|nr:CHC2 zinc finger domain-containing protein [Marinibactrum halimedae]MCD9461164.1 CHC2 zinc finger domain-containing protein [Marinibactrum halimedae]MCD9461170.1 CHC2 zinc finger domain-containing protein [Marinibactrum halimedae]GLS24605.1 hypothetical protein GCM10007877_03190 [Marinibactrum halimedae]
MARIAEEVINKIKSDISLVRLAESQGFKLVKQGKDYAVCCPFHEEKTPSCIISPESNLFNCFGCGAGGSVIDWVMKTQGVSFRLAVELLQNDIGAISTTPTTPIKKTTVQKLSSSLAADLQAADTAEALHQVVNYYHETLLNAPDALAYLEKRGLNHPELITEFKLGFANRTLAYHLPHSNREAGAKARNLLKNVGILRESGHEHFNGSIVVPVFDEHGNITEMYGRKLLDNLRKGTPKHTYLPGAHDGVFNEKALKNQSEIILCESLIDAMTFWVHGFKNVTASYGTQGFTASHLAAFKRYGIKRVLIAYDRDEPGNTAADKHAAMMQAEGIDCFRILFPKGMDANFYALQVTPARKSLELVIRKAEWLGNGKQPEITTEMTEDSDAPLATLFSETEEPEEEPENETEVDSVAEEKNEAIELPPLAASPLPHTPDDGIRCEISERQITLDIGGRVYRVRGLNANQDNSHLKINLMACNDNGFHNDTLELYNAKQRQVFINQAHLELGVKDEVIKKDLGKVLLKLEALQDQQALENIEPESKLPEITTEEKSAALQLLQDKNLLARIASDFNRIGLIGEDSNKLVGYLACVSRKLQKPLGVVIQSSSAAGKSSLMESILKLMPPEERIQYSAMTGQSLYYLGETSLKHKILAIAEEEGASNASYALKLLQSEGEVTIASTGKDDTTGNLITKEYRVEGPAQLFMTTTAIDIDEELLNRCLVLSVDESQTQTKEIHQRQRFADTLDGLFMQSESDELIEQHRNAQRLLKSYAIVNPYAEQLTFLSDKTRTRRDHMKYLTLIKTITLLHQYQREIKTETRGDHRVEYLEVTLNDIDMANQLAHQVLGRTLDELPPQTRKLLTLIQTWVQQQCQQQQIVQSDFRFSRRHVRELCGWSEKQVRVHMQRLMEMEYVITHRGGRGQTFEYELLYNGEGDQQDKFMLGLVGTESIKNKTTTATSSTNKETSCPQRGPIVGGSSEVGISTQPLNGKAYKETSLIKDKNTNLAVKNNSVVASFTS